MKRQFSIQRLLILSFFSIYFIPNLTKACADSDIDGDYFNLLSQEIVENPYYHSFLLTYYPGYYFRWEDEKPKKTINHNLKEWQSYFENRLSYDEVKELVFKSKKEDFTSSGRALNELLQKIPNDKINAVASYLYWAKVIEPYALSNQWYEYNWRDESKTRIQDETLDYDKIIGNLKRAYQNENDNELKLRYAYQMVRLAHYYFKFQESVNLFDTYAKPLANDSEIYYYTMEQKAGALHGLGKVDEANYLFLKVFSNSIDRLESAMRSIIIFDDGNYQNLNKRLKTKEEKASLQMLLARKDFQNPLPYLKEIDQIYPNSPQAQVVWVRAINELERSMLNLSGTCLNYERVWYADEQKELDKCTDHGMRLPTYNVKNNVYLQELLQYSNQIAKTQKGTFYQLTNAYLHFINQDFSVARNILKNLNANTPKQQEQITYLNMLIDVSEPEIIDDKFEREFYKKYKSTLTSKQLENHIDSWYWSGQDAIQYILDILGNRYYLQKEYAKSFLCHNSFESLEYRQNLDVINDLEVFVNETNLNEFEQILRMNLNVQPQNYQNKIHDFRGTYYIKQNQLELALKEFEQITDDYQMIYYKYDYSSGNGVEVPYSIEGKQWNGYSNISNKIFYMNLMECFNCNENTVMKYGSTKAFDFIKPLMSKQEVANALVQLQKLSKKNDSTASKALQLLGNFYYNITDLGYYRHIFHYDLTNANNSKFDEYHDEYSYYDSYNDSKYNFKQSIWSYRAMADTKYSYDYYKDALTKSENDEQKAEILYGMAKAESGLFFIEYMNLIEQNAQEDTYSDDWDAKIRNIRNSKYKKAFAQLEQYNHTKMGSAIKNKCKFYQYYLRSW